MKRFFITIFFFTAANINIMAQNDSDMQKLSWILDRWVSSNGETVTYEHWEKVSDTLFTGGSQTIRGGDTIFSEKLSIELMNGEIIYFADVKHNPAPVGFKLTGISATEAVFENQEHDFPQKITYTYLEGKLKATIEGPGKNESWRKTDFIMDRMR